ncbi:MAG: sodium-dependent transporter [Bacteroidales bacterium]|nr:sodium-dependent transporter [Bacteroidales bacterium]MCB9000258.1 sodium-dependent transporter [Bacteroidales bacterium]MCB9013792.1 sodium-dependent transporter [Bacteroidales bacterium]
MAGISNKIDRDSFSGKFAVIAATAGSAVGLGNIWRFPYVAGENGGGAFLFVYLIIILAIGIPVMMSEFVIGRAAQKNPYGAFKTLAPKKPWFLIGLMGVVAAFMILAFYTAVSGWTLEYIYQSASGNLIGKNHEQLTNMFDTFLTGSVRPVLWFMIFMSFTGLIVMSGIRDGIEKYTRFLMPMLFVILAVLCIRSVTLPGASKGIYFLFHPDFSKINSKVILEALGQAFFSMSIGMGTLITYGSYFPKNDNMASSAGFIALTDTLVAIIAGLAIFPAVFAFGGSPGSGEGLVFITLPGIFQQMPGGVIFSLLFFVLLAVAALTSTISVLEVIVAYFTEELGMTRKRATGTATILVSVLGVVTVLSWSSLGFLKLFNKNIFELLEFSTANVMLPIGGFFIVIFIGWFFGKKRTTAELSNEGELKVRYMPLYMFIVRFVAPVAIAMVFLYGLGFFNPSEKQAAKTDPTEVVDSVQENSLQAVLPEIQDDSLK